MKENYVEPSTKRRKFLQILVKDWYKEYVYSQDSRSTPTWDQKKHVCELFDVPDQHWPPLAEEIPLEKEKSPKTRCASCKFFVCKEHSAPVNCVQEANEMTINYE